MIYVAAIALAGMAAVVLFMWGLLAVRRARVLRRQEYKLSNAFDRARYLRVCGNPSVGSRFGIYDERVRRSGLLR